MTDSPEGRRANAPPDAETRRQLKRIAHHLDPVVRVGEYGVSAAVVEETQRALDDHELIKVRIHAADRDVRTTLAAELAGACEAAVIQRIGKVAVLFRRNPQPNPRLSNLARFAEPD